MEHKEYWLWASMSPCVTAGKLRRLLDVFGDIESVFKARTERIASVEGISAEDATGVDESRRNFNPDEVSKTLREKNLNFVCVDDDSFPKRLRVYCGDAFYLFYKGNLPSDSSPTAGIVGARGCSRYGKSTALSFGRDLSSAGIQIISGMARGIDSNAHSGALCGKTPTFAVLGCGADICYPAENIELYGEIQDSGGGILSEYMPGTKPFGWNFPARNRLISALSDALIVVEAREKSGSLITVEWALEQGKDVFAVPGRISDPLSRGCNRLIKAGAGILTDISDILPEISEKRGDFDARGANEIFLEKELSLVYSDLGLDPKSLDTLVDETGIPYESVICRLLQLQLSGLVEETGKNFYARVISN